MPSIFAKKFCGAKCRKVDPETGEKKLCTQPAMKNGRCKMHGGKSLPAGPLHPAYKHGKYSAITPKDITADYIAALNDPAFLELREEIALVDGRLAQLLRRTQTGESGTIWKKLTKAVRKLKEYQRMVERYDRMENSVLKEEAQADVNEQMDRIIGIVEQGDYDNRQWAEIGMQIELRKRLAESERKHQMEQRQMVPITQMQIFISELAMVIKSRVFDPETVRLMRNDIYQLMATKFSDVIGESDNGKPRDNDVTALVTTRIS